MTSARRQLIQTDICELMACAQLKDEDDCGGARGEFTLRQKRTDRTKQMPENFNAKNNNALKAKFFRIF